MDHQELETGLKKAAEESGIVILDDLLDDDAMGKASLRGEQFLEAVRHAKPKFVYVATITFDATGKVFDKLDIEDDDHLSGELLKHEAVVNFLKKWKRHDGQISLWVASFSHEAISHTCVLSPNWRDAFDEALEGLADDVADTLESLKQTQNADERAIEPWLIEKAEQLVNHPAFNAPRVSKEKRTFLAEQLFPELESYQRFRIVERATNIAWLRDAVPEN